MDTHLKSKFQEIIESLEESGEVKIIQVEKKALEILKEIEKELNDYRFENQKRIKESQEEISTVVLTA